MNALLDLVHNFILPLVRGEDRVCACTCGRHQAHHVIPYHGAEAVVDGRENSFVTDIMTQQEVDVIIGLLFGLSISWLLLWLGGVWNSSLKHWRANRLNDVGFWSQMLRFSDTKDFSSWLHLKYRGLQGERVSHSESCIP